MTLVSKNIPNLINGVSQQPPALRLASQAEAQENGFSDIVDGLKKRPPTQLKNKLKKTAPTGNDFLSTTEINRSHFHTYKRSTVEQYTVVTDPVIPKMYVYDIDGNLRYESGVASWDAGGAQITANSDNTSLAAYLGTGAIDNTQVAATSVADYTFFVNKDKVVAKDTSTPSNVRPHEAVIYMKVMNYGKDYKWQVSRDNDPLTAVDDTWSGVTGQATTRDGGGNDSQFEVQGLKTGNYFDLTVNGTASTYTTVDPQVSTNILENQITVSDASLTAQGLQSRREQDNPFVVIETTQTNGADFKIKVSDDNGGNDLFGFKDRCKNFISLPQYCVDGFTIQVNGDTQKKEDDFYVKYEGSNTLGTWKECAAPSRPNTPVYHEFDTATMPHTLSQKADLSFTFGTSTWDERKCGDEDTNPFPSFVGGKINGVFFHRNRLGFLSDENVIFSEASSYFNFFRVTVRSLLDSAPIDVAVSQNEVSLLKAAVPAQDNLILFSDLTQFTLSADQLLTPSEIVIDQSTKYECDLTSTPVGAGTSVFFTTKSGDYSGVREFFTKDESENKDAPSITSHVPEYLNGTVRQMIASSNEDMLVCLTETDKKECYVYKWYNSDQERIQSSWSKWVFSKEITHVFFNNATLTIIFSDGGYEEMSLAFSEASTLNIHNIVRSIHLDHRKVLTGLVSQAALLNVYTPTANTQYVDHEGNLITTGTPANGSALFTYLAGTHIVSGVTCANYVYAGEAYTFKYKLSEQVFKAGDKDPTRMARYQLRSVLLNYTNTGSFDVTVASTGRADKVTNFTGRILGQVNNILGYSPVIEDGSLKVGIQSQAQATDITITNDTHLPSTFQNAEVEAFVTLRNKRM